MSVGRVERATDDEKGPITASTASPVIKVSMAASAVAESPPSSSTNNSMGDPLTPPLSLMARTAASTIATRGSPMVAPGPDRGTSRAMRSTPSLTRGAMVVVRGGSESTGAVVVVPPQAEMARRNAATTGEHRIERRIVPSLRLRSSSRIHRPGSATLCHGWIRE
jgi:hypothetical protein